MPVGGSFERFYGQLMLGNEYALLHTWNTLILEKLFGPVVLCGTLGKDFNDHAREFNNQRVLIFRIAGEYDIRINIPLSRLDLSHDVFIKQFTAFAFQYLLRDLTDKVPLNAVMVLGSSLQFNERPIPKVKTLPFTSL